MSRTFIVLLGLGLLATFGYYCVYVHSTSSIIQNDIDSRVKSSIDTQVELEGISVITDGRDITLNGEVASEELKQRAVELATSEYGVRKVSNQLTVTIAEPAIEPVIETPPDPEPAPETVKTVKEIIQTPDVEELPEYSCQQDFDILLENSQIQFTTSSAVIEALSHSLLNDLINAATQCNEAKFEIAGHTDSQGNADYNLDLSQQRASSVMDYFIQNGIHAERLSAVGYGESIPIADNDTADGRAENRRIELTVKLEEIQ